MRARPFAPWYTAFVCIVPPCIGCGWPKTTAARGGDDSLPPASRSASSRPAGPVSSRGMSSVVSVRRRLGGGNERGGDVQERAGFRDDADVSGTAQLGVAGAGNQPQVFERA